MDNAKAVAEYWAGKTWGIHTLKLRRSSYGFPRLYINNITMISGSWAWTEVMYGFAGVHLGYRDLLDLLLGPIYLFAETHTNRFNGLAVIT